jgi:hypothetical protein
MSIQLDASIGLGKETTWGSAVVTDRFFEFVDESIEWKPTFLQGAGLRVGSRVQRSSRRKLGKQEAGGDINIEAVTKGIGRILEAVFGNSTSTQIAAGPAYQQVHTPLTSGLLPSYTIQKGSPPIGGGAPSALTFSGAVCSAIELSAATGDIVKLKSTWSAKDVSTVPAYAAPSYPISPELFTFVDGAITVGGTITLPTSTTLATGGTQVANITDFSLTYDNKIDDGGFTFGAGGKKSRKPVVGLAEVKGKMTAEYSDNTLRDAYMQQLPLAIVLTFQAQVAITGSTYPTLQIVIPLAKLDGDLPKSNGGKPIMQSIDFEVLDPEQAGTAPIYIVFVTSDTAV